MIGGSSLARTANFTNHNDTCNVWIALKEIEAVCETYTAHHIAADPDDIFLPEAALSE